MTALMVIPVQCKTNCPDPTKECAVDNVQKKYSDVNNWPNKQLPKEGDKVEILCPWKMLLDVDETPIFEELLISGELIFDDTRTLTKLRAKKIYIK